MPEIVNTYIYLVITGSDLPGVEYEVSTYRVSDSSLSYQSMLLLSWGKEAGCWKAVTAGLYQHLFYPVATPLTDAANEDRRMVSIPRSLESTD